MKRFLFILLFIFILLIGVMAVIPLFFKNTVSEQLKTAINKQIEGTVNFKGFHISLFNQFPKVELQVIDFCIIGNNEFKNDTLASVSELTGTITVSELFTNHNMQITHLYANRSYVLLKTTENGTANWELTSTSKKPKEKSGAEKNDEKKEITIMLEQLVLDNFNLKYIDESSRMMLAIKDLSTQSKGEIKGEQINLNLNTQVQEFVFKYDSVPYLSNTSIKISSQLACDLDKMNFTFNAGKVWLNNFLLQLNGSFAIPSDSMYFELQLNSNSKSFKDLLAMVPADYQSYLEKVEADGSSSLSAGINGWYYEDNYPAFQVNANISDANFHYTDLPEKIEKINLQANISKPQGKLDQMIINIPQATASLQDVPINAKLQITTPVSNPHYEAEFKGKLDFNTLNKAIPMEGTDLQGQLNAHLSLQGKQSDIDNEAYDRFKSNGNISLENFIYHSKNLKKPIRIKSAKVAITTPRIEMKSLNGNIGESHFSLNGVINNYLPYFTKKGILKGNFNLNSDFVNLTELVNLQNQLAQKTDSSALQAKQVDADSILAFELPERLDLKFRSDIKKARFDKMYVTKMNGLINVKGQTLALDHLKMQMLQGSLLISGLYIGNPQLHPDFNCSIKANDFDVQAAYQSLSLIRRYLPIAARSKGKLSSSLQLKGKMNEKLELITPSLDGEGTLNSKALMIVDDPTFSQLKGIIKSEKLKNITINDFSARFQIEKGNILIDPFTTEVANQETTIQGKVSVDRQLDFNLDFKLNRNDLGGDINKVLELIPGSENIKKVNTGVKITGSIKNPDVAIDLDKTRKQIINEAKKASTKEIKEKAKKLGNELLKLFN